MHVGNMLLPNCHSAQHSNCDKQKLCQHKLGSCRASLASHQKAGLIMRTSFGSNTSVTSMRGSRLVCFRTALHFQLKSDMPDQVTNSSYGNDLHDCFCFGTAACTSSAATAASAS